MGKSRGISHGRKAKKKHSHGLTRKYTERRISRSRDTEDRRCRSICHGLTRKNTEGRISRSSRRIEQAIIIH
jgi:hypothetical protein